MCRMQTTEWVWHICMWAALNADVIIFLYHSIFLILLLKQCILKRRLSVCYSIMNICNVWKIIGAAFGIINIFQTNTRQPTYGATHTFHFLHSSLSPFALGGKVMLIIIFKIYFPNKIHISCYFGVVIHPLSVRIYFARRSHMLIECQTVCLEFIVWLQFSSEYKLIAFATRNPGSGGNRWVAKFFAQPHYSVIVN